MFMPCTYLYFMPVQMSTLSVDRQAICRLSSLRLEEGPQHTTTQVANYQEGQNCVQKIIKLH
jgi:hypothetical protein